MDMGHTAHERERQTVYSIRRWNFFKWFWCSWCRGLLVSPQLREGSAASHESSGSEDAGAHSSAHTELRTRICAHRSICGLVCGDLSARRLLVLFY
jgi:hypothetical protein